MRESRMQMECINHRNKIMLALMSVFFYLGMEMHLCYLDPLYLAFWNRHGHKHKY